MSIKKPTDPPKVKTAKKVLKALKDVHAFALETPDPSDVTKYLDRKMASIERIIEGAQK